MMTLYRGSVKDLVGPIPVGGNPAVVFEYSDAYSVFDWGRMPDPLTGKGESLAIMAAEIFERIEKPETWREFSKSNDALALRKGNRLGALFNEMGEVLQSQGLRTHYLGVLDQPPSQGSAQLKRIGQVQQPFRRMVVKQVSAVKPLSTRVLGRTVPDYTPTRASPLPRLVPLEVVFRMGAPEGSSLLERVKRDPEYLASLGFPDLQLSPGVRWDFPMLELFTKLEPSDRLVSFAEGMAISGVSAPQLQDILLKSTWLAGLLHYWFARMGLYLADGKFEWGVGVDGNCFLVDAVGLDELRVLKDGAQLSKEFLRGFYRKTPWFDSVQRAKSHAKKLGSLEWKRWVQEAPPALPARHKDLAIQIYQSLTQEFTGKKWFGQTWGLEQVTRELSALREAEGL